MTFSEIAKEALKINDKVEIFAQRESWKQDGTYLSYPGQYYQGCGFFKHTAYNDQFCENFSIKDFAADDWTLECDYKTINKLKKEHNRKKQEERIINIERQKKEEQENYTGISYAIAMTKLKYKACKSISRKSWHKWAYIFNKDNELWIHSCGDKMAGSVDCEYRYTPSDDDINSEDWEVIS